MTFPVSPAAPGGRHHAAAGSQAWYANAGYGDPIPTQRGDEHGPRPGSLADRGPAGTDWWTQPGPSDDRGPAGTGGWTQATPDPRYAPGYGRPGAGGSPAPSPQDQSPPHRWEADFTDRGPAFEAPRPQGHAWERTDLADPGWADRRYRAASTLKHVIAKHTHEAFDRFERRDALAPHGVVLFYELARRNERGQQVGYELFKVIRLFLDGPESADLFKVLDDLRRSAEANIHRAATAGHGWDPRGPQGSMVNSGDMDMPREARYLGVAVETLNTDHGDWHTVARSIRNQSFGGRTVFDLAGQGFALLTDGTAMHVVRDPNVRAYGDSGIKSSKPLDISQAHWHNRYANLMQQGDQPTQMTWAYLNQLHETLGTYLLGRPPS